MHHDKPTLNRTDSVDRHVKVALNCNDGIKRPDKHGQRYRSLS